MVVEQPTKILGAVLAGGRSTRFGRDKALALLNGRPLIELAIASLHSHCSEVVVCGRQMSGMLCIDDRPVPKLGPLGGLNAALHYGCSAGFNAVLTLGCDMPFLPANIDDLFGSDTAVISGQHLIGYWPTSLAARLDSYLKGTDDYSIRAWLKKVGPRYLIASGPELPNINTRDDLKALESNSYAISR